MRLILIVSLVDSWNGPLWMAIQAIGNIRKYQIIISLFSFLNLPFAIIAFYFNASPVWILVIRFILNLVAYIWRVFFLKRKIDFPIKKYFLDVALRSIIFFLFSITITFFISRYINNYISKFFATCFISIIINTIFILLFGLTVIERMQIKKIIKCKYNRWRKK